MAQRGMSAPYGDIYFVNTPAIDRWGQQLYAEQKTREIRMQQENAMLDANIQKELGRVRSVDTPEVISAYQQYKQLSKELMFNESLRKDPLAYNQARQAASQAYRNIFSVANQSAEAKTLAKTMLDDRMKRPNDFKEHSGSMISALMNTPLSRLNSHPEFGDLTNPDNYLDMGMNTDWGKMLKEAIGTPREVYSEKSPMEGGLQTQITPYTFGNTPLQVKDYLIGSMGMRQSGRDAARAWDNTPESEIESTIKQYQALPKEYWQRMGLSEPQNLFPKNPNNKSENWAAYQAMKYAIANEPRQGKPQVVQNLKAVKDLEFNRARQLEAIKQGNREDLVRLRKSLPDADSEVQNVWYQNYLNRVIEEAKNGSEGEKPERHHVFLTKSGKSLFYYNLISPDAFIMKAFARDIGEPDRIGVTDNGKIVPIFFERDDKKNIKKVNGTPIMNSDYSVPMTYEQALVSLGFRGSTKTQLSKDMQRINKNQPEKTKTSVEELKKKYNLDY